MVEKGWSREGGKDTWGRGGTTSSAREGERERKTDTLSFELEAKVLLEPGRNSPRPSAKGPKKTASSQTGKNEGRW